jgi:predicted AlkP superfamily pyrophosphatase or phosphodiesterase
MKRLIKLNALFLLIYILFCEIYAAPTRSKNSRSPILLVSVDGLRADKLDEFLMENPKSAFQTLFVDQGVKAVSMMPSFPSITFPNHYTMVTGRYTENHGIVGNLIYDPKYDRKVYLYGASKSFEIQWYNQSDPIWLTARRQVRWMSL